MCYVNYCFKFGKKVIYLGEVVCFFFVVKCLRKKVLYIFLRLKKWNSVFKLCCRLIGEFINYFVLR